MEKDVDQIEAMPARTIYKGEQSKMARTLNKEIIEVKTTEKEYKVSIEELMSTTASSLPVEFLLRHKMFKYVKKIAVERMQRVIYILRIRILQRGFKIWSTYTRAEVLIERTKATFTIQMAFRLYNACRKSRALAAAKLMGEKIANGIAIKSKQQYLAKITLIQSYFRMFICRNQYIIQRDICLHAVCTLQKQYRRHLRKKNGGLSMFQAVQIMQQRLKSTFTIQRLYRGFLGRMRCRFIRMAKHRKKKQLRYESREELFNFYFEQHGAARRLQRWAWSMGWPLEARKKRRKRILEKRLHIHAITIQRIYRGYNCCKAYKIIKEKARHKKLLRMKMKAVVKIQAIVRGMLGRQNAKEIAVMRRGDFISRIIFKTKKFLIRNTRKRPLLLVTKPINPEDMKFRERRGGFSYDNLRIGNERRMKLMDQKALRIQLVWKVYVAKTRNAKLREIRKKAAALKLQKWLIHRKRLNKMKAAIAILGPFLRKIVFVRKNRDKAVRKIQNAWRYFIAHLHVHRRRVALHRLKRLCRHIITRRAKREALRKKRLVWEENLVGQVQHARTLDYKRIDEFWKGAQRKPSAKQELQMLFAQLGPTGLLESGRLIKMLKGSNSSSSSSSSSSGLFDKNFVTNDIEILFAKHRRPPEKNLTYPQMLNLLSDMAIMKYFTSPNTSSSSNSFKSSVSDATSPLPSMSTSIASNSNSITKASTKRRPLSPVSICAANASRMAVLQRRQGTAGLSSPSVASPPSPSSLESVSRPATVTVSRRSARRSSKSVTDSLIENESATEEIKFKYGRLQGRGAIITCFIDQYFAPTAIYRKVVADLKGDSSSHRANAIVTAAVLRTQAFCRHRLLAKMTWRMGREFHAGYLEHCRKLATIQIQRIYRGWLGRKRAVLNAQEVYVKCVDADAGHPYWFNNITEASFWRKPKLLREFDCGEAVLMPPSNELCTAPCQGDKCARYATMYCNDCDSILCGQCSHTIHSEGRRKTHEVLHLTHCAQCGFQLATRYCRSCGDHYCDCCFKWIHRKGRLRLHTSTWVCDRCDVCEERAAWLVQQDEYYKTTAFCRICFENVFGLQDPLQMDNVFPVQYLGPAVKDHLMKKKLAEEKRHAEMKLKEMRSHDTLKKLLKSIVLIQKLYRAYKSRKEIASWLAQRRLALHLRKHDEKFRVSYTHRFLSAIGMAPRLSSDTPMEFTMRLFPWYLKDTVNDCIGHDWTAAATMGGWGKEKSKRTVSGGIQTFIHLQSMKAEVRRCRKKVETKAREQRAFNKQYLETRALSGSYALLKEKKQQAENALLEQAEKDLTDANSNWQLFKDGDAGACRRFVNQQVANGIPLGIKGRLVRGSQSLRIKKSDARVWNSKTYAGCYILLRGSLFRIITGDFFLEAFGEADFQRESEVESEEEQDEEQDQEGVGDLSLVTTSSTKTKKKPKKVVDRHPSQIVRKTSVIQNDNDNYNNQINSTSLVTRKSISLNEDPGGDSSGLLGQQQRRGSQASLKTSMNAVLEDEFTVLLDRPWTLSNQTVDLFRMPAKPLHHRITSQVSRALLRSPPVQLGVRVATHGLHGMAMTFLQAADMFDEEAVTRHQCRNIGLSLTRSRDKVMLRSSTTIRLKSKKAPRMTFSQYLEAMWTHIQKSKHEMENHIIKVRDIQEMHPYKRWEKSISKADIDCMLELDDGTTAKLIGTFKMDLDAPCDVMREYIERHFRDILNQSVGEDFCFYLPGAGGGELLARKMEPRAWSKDYAELKETYITRQAGIDTHMDDFNRFELIEEGPQPPHVVTIIRDRFLATQGKVSMIPEFPPEEGPVEITSV
eukprot:gene2271-4420_t